MSYVIGVYDPTTKSVPVTFDHLGQSYKRLIRAVLNPDNSYNASLTDTFVKQIVSGNVSKAEIDDLSTRVVGGMLSTVVWTKLPSVYKIVTNGVGLVSIDTKKRDGTITTNVATFTATGVEGTEYIYFGSEVGYIRATLTGTATAEIV